MTRALPALLLLLTGCTLETRPPVRAARSGEEVLSEARAEAEVRAVLLRYYADLAARDWRAWRAHFSAHGTVTALRRAEGGAAPRLETLPVDSFVTRATGAPADGPVLEVRMRDLEVRVSGNLSQAWARSATRFGGPESPSTGEERDAFTLMRQSGVWRIVALAYTEQ